MLKTSTPMLRSSTGCANCDLCSVEAMLTGMAILKVSTVVLDVHGHEIDQQGAC